MTVTPPGFAQAAAAQFDSMEVRATSMLAPRTACSRRWMSLPDRSSRSFCPCDCPTGPE